MTLTLLIDPLKCALPEGAHAEIPVLFRIQAPPAPEEGQGQRPPLHLALVLDRSGSMRGRPLQEAIRCAQAIIRQLSPKDRVAVVTYDDRAQLLAPCAPVADIENLCRRLEHVRPGGTTNLHGGWELGVGELRKADADGVLSQVLLLSDGIANQGIVDPVVLAGECAKAKAIGIRTSTYGLGQEFQETLMTAMARQGQGRAYYGESSEDLLGPFLEEFELLSDLYAPEVVLRLEANPGVQVIVKNPYPALGVDGWALPSLPYSGELWALAVVRLSPEAMAIRSEAGLACLLRPVLEWRGRDGSPRRQEFDPLELPVVPVEAFAALKESPLVRLRLRDLKVSELQDAIYRQGLDGDWDGARNLLDELAALAGEDPTLQEVVSNLREMAKREEGRQLAVECYYSAGIFSSSMGRAHREASEWTNETEQKSYFRQKKRVGKQEPPPSAPKPPSSPSA